MSSSDDLPRAWPSIKRVVRLGYRTEPRLLLVTLALTLLSALPDALLAVWLAVFTNGVVEHDGTKVGIAAAGLALSATGTWFLSVVLTRADRRFRDRIGIAFQSRVAELHADVATVEHFERPEHADRLSVLRDQIFALDHLFGSMFMTVGWVVRLVFVLVLLGSVQPMLILLVVFAAAPVWSATWRPSTITPASRRWRCRARSTPPS